jgi:apolipoprotein N-acyltransferase
MLSSLFLMMAPVLSGVLLVLAFPRYDLGWLAWVGLVPLFLVLYAKRPLVGFFLALVTGIVFIAGIFNWILVIKGYELYHHAILVLYLALYFGIFGLVFILISRRRGLSLAFLSAPFMWISLEYLRSNFFFLALPWALLAHSQHDAATIIQIASITGAYGVSFLIVLVNSTFALIILALTGRLGWVRVDRAILPTNKAIGTVTLVTILLMIVAFAFGLTVLSRPKSGQDIRISVLQGDVEQSKKWDPDYANAIMKKYTDLSHLAAADNPRLIVWPEAATPGLILKNMKFHQETTRMIRGTDCFYLIGSSEYPKFQKNPPTLDQVGNSALFFSPHGKVLGQYFKRHLVPFVEYIPYKNSFDWPHFIVPQDRSSWEVIGKEFTLFEIDGARFGVSICWESLFPHHFRQFANSGAGFMLNISSEAWFGVSAFQYQFLAATKFRAIENRTFIARAGNYAISCFIDPYGKILGMIPKNGNDNNSFGRGHLTHNVTVSGERTFYTSYGDVFMFLVLGVTLLVMVSLFFKSTMSEPYRYFANQFGDSRSKSHASHQTSIPHKRV